MGVRYESGRPVGAGIQTLAHPALPGRANTGRSFGAKEKDIRINHVEHSFVYHTAITILHDIGTLEEIAVIDKAKENSLLATDGDFWKKAADAKKAILARAEEKKKAELKAKPLDK